MDYKIIVAHPERQHSFRVASALKKNGALCKYITTVYNKESSLLMKLIKMFVSSDNKKRVDGRTNQDLQDDDVLQFCEIRGLIQVALYRFDKSKVIYNWWHKMTSRAFGKKVAKYAIKNNADAVILYDSNAMTCFKILKEKAPHIKRIMDVSAANRLYMKEIYEADMEKCKSFAEKLKNERNFLWRSNYCQLLKRELEYTEWFIPPSSFVKKSLMYSGVKEEQIKLCPYGTNFSVDSIELDENKKHPLPLKAIYVGNVTEMKGIYYLLEAVMEIPKEKLELTMVGHYDNSTGVLDKYLDRVNFTGRVVHDRVQEILLESDVFVFPSLGEGMSLSVLEAMACGLPCIVTENSGVSEVIQEGVNGFEIQAQNKEAIKEKLEWFISNTDRITEMGLNSSEVVKKYTWENHEERLMSILNDILK